MLRRPFLPGVTHKIFTVSFALPLNNSRSADSPRPLNCSIPRGNIGSLVIAVKRPKISGALTNNQRRGALMEIPVGQLLNLPDIQVLNVEIT